MYPYELFWGLDLYSLLLLTGVVSSFIIFRICADRRDFSAKLQNLILFDGFVSVVAGYFGTVLFQGIYNGIKTGTFVLDKNTGATFLGGLIVGVAIFFLVYFTAGHFLFKKSGREHITRLWDLISIGAGAIASAHAFGRIGCFFAGCCYGIPTDSFIGVQFPGMHHKVLPVQLFESAFLFILFGVIMFLNMKKKDFIFGMPLYMVGYGVWRYFIEFLRGDDRGEFFIKIFTPSQFTSVLMVIGGIVLGVFLYKKFYAKKKE